MFTGLVRAIGRLERCSGGVQVQLERAGALGEIALGDSIAVDGICLTVAEILGGHGGAAGFRADVSEETLRRSALAERAAATARVNLEPALRPLDRLGGHLVSGHVDGIGRVLGIEREAGSWRLELGWEDPGYGRYICPKASVAVDGISLTVAGCAPDGAAFWIAVIPHTWGATTLLDRRRGDRLNLEADLLAKYTERLLTARLGPAAAGTTAQEGELSNAWLAEHGWLG
ncbi:MAG: riboflavin synthase [Cyanobium sp.]